MGKRTDAYSAAVDQYTTDSTPQKNAILQADNDITRLWQAIPALEQAANRQGGSNAQLRTAFSDLAEAKNQKHAAMVELNKLVSAFNTKTVDFEKAMKEKKKSLNPFKSKDSLPTAEATIQHAKRLITADKLLIKL